MRNKSSCQKITDRVFEVMKENLINHTSLVRVMAGKKLNINDKKELIKILKKNDVEKAGLFGSYARGDAREDSDIDILVEFDPDHIPGLIRLAKMENELSSIIGCKADIRTAEDLSRYFRQAVLESAEVKYAAG